MRYDVRQVIRDELRMAVPEGARVAVALSSGVDSLAVLYALRELGYSVVAYSFTLSDRESTDFRVARDEAIRVGASFVPVILPTDRRDMPGHVREVVRMGGSPTKTAVECLWPWFCLIRLVREPYLTGGWGADPHFVISRRGMVHHRGSRASMDDFREQSLRKLMAPGGQTDLIRRLSFGLRRSFFVSPWLSPAMAALFRGSSWEEINRPRQKEPIASAFPEQFAHVKVRPHGNLQLGDSGIADLWYGLLRIPELNIRGRRAPAALYRDIAEGRAGKWPGNVSLR